MLAGAYRKNSNASTEANRMRLTPPSFPARGPLGGLLMLALTACGPAEVSSDPVLAALAGQIGLREAQLHPETASRVGIPDEIYGGTYADRLNDRSMAALARMRVDRLDHLAALQDIDPGRLSPIQRRTRASLISMLEAVTAVDAYGYGSADFTTVSPYAVSFSDGAFSELVKFLTLSAPLRTSRDVAPWLQRLEGFDEALRDERRRMEVDVSAGVAPPARVLMRTLEEARRLTPSIPRDHPLVTFFVERVAQMPEISSQEVAELTQRAVDLVGGEIRTEYARLTDLLEKSLAGASEDPGVWRLKDGDGYYAAALRFYTTTDMPAAQLHDAGGQLLNDLSAQIEPLLLEAGLTEGTIGSRLRQLSDNPAYLLPDTPEGQAALVKRITDAVAASQKETMGLSPLTELPAMAVREAIALAEDDSRSAYYTPAALDGSQPSTLTVNLRSSLDVPLWTLPAMAWREGVPGGHLPEVMARAAREQQLISFFMPVPAFNAGWAVYAEDLGEELGAYGDDPLSRIGYLQSLMLQAALMVVDTGIHFQKWPRERALAYLTDTVGLTPSRAEVEIDHITLWPGRACSAIVGRETLRRLRGQAQRELGAAFDLKGFHEAVLAPGPRPLPVLETDVAEWILSRRPAPAAE